MVEMEEKKETTPEPETRVSEDVIITNIKLPRKLHDAIGKLKKVKKIHSMNEYLVGLVDRDIKARTDPEILQIIAELKAECQTPP